MAPLLAIAGPIPQCCCNVDGPRTGLPLLNMSPRKVISILSGAFSYVHPGGYQFTYGMRCPVPQPILDRLGLRATLVDRALLNVPPAAVYRLTRRPQYKLLTRDAAPTADAGISPSPRSTVPASTVPRPPEPPRSEQSVP